MNPFCEFIANKTAIFDQAPDALLISNAVMAALSDGFEQRVLSDFAAFERRGSSNNYRPCAELEGAPRDLKLGVIVGADFNAWAELHSLVTEAGLQGEMTVVILVPTEGQPMGQACLDQFVTETSIRAQSFAYSGEMRVVELCSRDDCSRVGLDLTTLERPPFATTLGRFLDTLVPDDVDRVALVVARTEPLPAAAIPHAPLFTVLTRTQGKRMETLREVLLCLSAQTVGDFEHLIVAHNVAPESIVEIRTLIDSQSEWSRSRTRFEEVHGGTRTTPLNAGFAMAAGRYVVILDDDDIVFANWLETFRKIARNQPGSLLRAVAVRQDFTWAHVQGKRAARAVGAMQRLYASAFDYLEHLEVSQTPPVSIAFPRYLFARHGMHFDDTLTTTEDWDYIMRCAARVGVGSDEEITCIYRWWVDAENSRTVHKQSEWIDNHNLIQKKIDDCVNLLEPGSMRRFSDIAAKMNEYLRWANKLHTDMQEIQAAADVHDPEQVKQKIAELSRNVEDEISSIRTNSSSIGLTLVPPQEDMLPTPRLTLWHKFLGGPNILQQLRQRQRREVVRGSGIFDAQWYVSNYPDVAEQNLDPLDHFVSHGSRELRSPSSQFNAKSYYAAYTDLRDHKIEPVFHFVLHGRREGRRYEAHD